MTDRERVRIEAVRIKDLYAFASDFIDSAVAQDISPITKLRALSQSKNPYADPDDVALLVAFIDKKCVGYQGLLPVRLMTPYGPSKAFWGTAMYVHPDYRHRMVALYLTRKVLGLKLDLVLNEFSDAAAKLCAGMRFRTLPSCPYLQVRLDRLDLASAAFRAVRGSGGRYRACRNAAELGMRLSQTVWLHPLKRLIYARVVARGRRTLERFTQREVTRVRPVEGDGSSRCARFVRGADAVNWTLEFPWIRENGEPTTPPFYFADVYPLYRNHAVEISGRGGEYLGFVVLTILKPADRIELKVRDYALQGDRDGEVLFRVLMEYAARYNVDRLELPIELERWVRTEIPLAAVMTCRQERPYVCQPVSHDSPLAQVGNDVATTLNDGDTAFF